MRIQLPELSEPMTLVLGASERFSEEGYLDFCRANPDLNIERLSPGEIVIRPWVGYETDQRCAEVCAALGLWARSNGTGKASGPNSHFLLPDGAALSPDAAWTSTAMLRTQTREQLRNFPRIVPEFVVEVMSPSDRLSAAKKKMRRWMANGVELGWLIDGDRRTVYVYRGTEEPRVLVDAESVAGEGPVDGFVLPLHEIWAGL